MQTLLSTAPPTSKNYNLCRPQLPKLSQQPATALLSELHWLPVNSRITFKLACLTYKLLNTSQPAYLCTILHHYTPIRTLRSTNQFFLDVQRFSLNLVKVRLVTWLLQSGMVYLLTSDFHPLSTPPNAVWKLTFSISPSTPLPCCPPSDCQRLWFSTTTECVRIVNACNNDNNDDDVLVTGAV